MHKLTVQLLIVCISLAVGCSKTGGGDSSDGPALKPLSSQNKKDFLNVLVQSGITLSALGKTQPEQSNILADLPSDSSPEHDAQIQTLLNVLRANCTPSVSSSGTNQQFRQFVLKGENCPVTYSSSATLDIHSTPSSASATGEIKTVYKGRHDSFLALTDIAELSFVGPLSLAATSQELRISINLSGHLTSQSYGKLAQYLKMGTITQPSTGYSTAVIRYGIQIDGIWGELKALVQNGPNGRTTKYYINNSEVPADEINQIPLPNPQ